MRVLNVGAARRLSAVASLCTVELVVSSCGMVTITPKNAGEPTARTLTGLPSPAETAATDQPSTANESAQTSAKEQSANEQASKQTPLQQGARLPREVRERRGGRVHRGWVAHRLVCSCVVRALRAMCPHSSQVVVQGHGCSAVPSGVFCGRRWPCLCVVLI